MDEVDFQLHEVYEYIKHNDKYVWKSKLFDYTNDLVLHELKDYVIKGFLSMKDDSNIFRTKYTFTIKDKSTDREDKLNELLK